MRILQLIQKQQLRGAEMFAAQLSTHLQNQGHEVLMVSLQGGNADLPFSGDIISLDANLNNRFFDFRGWKKLAKIIQEFEPDIVQANAGDTLKYAIFSKKLFRWNLPVVFRNASMVSSYIRNPISKALIRYLFSQTQRFISVSEFTQKDLIEKLAILTAQTTVIPIGIELKPIQKLDAFNNGKINLVHVGGFSFEKNHMGLLSIFKEALMQEAQLFLWLIGDGPLKKEVEAKAKEMGIETHIRFVGFVSNPLDYIHSADMLLLPSIIEGLPGVIVEAFYCKTPVIANNVGGISELINHNHTGYLLEKGNEKGFAAHIIKMVNLDANEKNKRIEKAYALAMEKYNNEQIAISFATEYHHLVNVVSRKK